MMDPASLARKHYGTNDLREYIAMARAFEDLSMVRGPPESYTKMTVPYYAIDPALPPIPTPEEIERASWEKNTEEFLQNHLLVRLLRMNKVYAVKFSSNPSVLQEAENLLFLQDHEVKSAKLYAVFSHQGCDPQIKIWPRGSRISAQARSRLPVIWYIVTEWIDGITYTDDKDFFQKISDEEARRRIYRKIGEQLRLLRSIRPPGPSYYGRIHEQPFRGDFGATEYKRDGSSGPFYTYESFLQHQLNNFEVRLLWKCARYGGKRGFDETEKLFLSALQDAFNKDTKAGEPKLTHYDLAIHNVRFVRPSQGISESVEDWDVCLVDWEYLAWMPAYMEMAGAMYRLPREEDENMKLYDVFGDLKPVCLVDALIYFNFVQALGGHV